ncbi:MAG: signal peptidase I [Coriobacteriales bacterium]|jgi:signal peptidase I|nr:signal peptidase I [Coriobacteriales bacterium]
MAEREQITQAVAAKQPPRRKKKVSLFREIFDLVLVLVVALLLAFLLRTYVVDLFEIPTASMDPTIEINDRVLAEKVTYEVNPIRPGDIVTFVDPILPERILIKRVIAVEGQIIDFKDGNVVVDGTVLSEPYTHGAKSLPFDKQLAGVAIEYPYTVPADSVWVMGDNRGNSLDSRYFGPILDNMVIARGIVCVWPFDRIGSLY